MICNRCKSESTKLDADGICPGCVKAEIVPSKVSWIEIAEQNELELYDRQPGEFDKEWFLWLAYRDQYPHKTPKLKDAAFTIGMNYKAALKTSSKWSYKARLQAWAQHCNEQVTKNRSKEIVDMNLKQKRLASTMLDKLEKAIEVLDPDMLKPSDINSLFKTMTEIQRRSVEDEHVEWQPDIGLTGKNAIADKPVKKDDLAEVMSILAGAGVLQVNKIGLETNDGTTVVINKGGGNDE